MQRTCLLLLLTLFLGSATAQVKSGDLRFPSLAKQWDEAIPLGNALLGALVWEKDQALRFSLDRADLWDARPMNGLHRKEFSYAWVEKQVKLNDYGIVQQYFDAPYDREPAPSKIPGGAFQVNSSGWGEATDVHLELQSATCTVRWKNGTTLRTFVHADAPVGWFRFENLSGPFTPSLIAPRYQGAVSVSGDPVGGDDLSRLGYKQGQIKTENNHITYHQEGWGGFSYAISLRWKKINATTIEGVWSISSQMAGKPTQTGAAAITQQALSSSFEKAHSRHRRWWSDFWGKSALRVPDTLLQKQYQLELYKFGSAARKDAPPISLQAVWTADNGRLPPWKGDFHHDLNTQLSYWPAYKSNHLVEASGYINHLQSNITNYKRYTRQYFGVAGLAVPGVTTLDGTEMGGWIQYSLSPTVSSWLNQHFYWQWKYSMDKEFLRKTAYPWVKEVARFIENITVLDAAGQRKLPISSSPEIHENSIHAWFSQNTNYDLSLMKFTYSAAREMALALGLTEEAKHWEKTGSQFSDLHLSTNKELVFAPNHPYNESHRHFSHAMGIFPLGLLKWEDGPESQTIIKNSLVQLDSIGPDWWCGYSYAWLGNLKARAMDGSGAAKALTTFARAFCLPNSFHVNGDQTKSGLSKFLYRPFTLEGNFAFAAGLQEMVLQSYAGYIHIFPAIPSTWKEASFDQFRTEGAFLVSANLSGGKVTRLKIVAEKGGVTRLKMPRPDLKIISVKGVKLSPGKDDMVQLDASPGGYILLEEAQ